MYIFGGLSRNVDQHSRSQRQNAFLDALLLDFHFKISLRARCFDKLVVCVIQLSWLFAAVGWAVEKGLPIGGRPGQARAGRGPPEAGLQ